MAERTVTVAEFLFTRLHQLGCHSLHGLPGDFNLLALDYVEKSGVRWVGNCNELNAGYAADAYARIRGIGGTYSCDKGSRIPETVTSASDAMPLFHVCLVNLRYALIP